MLFAHRVSSDCAVLFCLEQLAYQVGSREGGKVDEGVALFKESHGFGVAAYTAELGERPEEPLCDGLPGEGEDNDIK